MKTNYYLCPTCKQDMRSKPHPGLSGRDCPQCGQGIKWKLAAKVKRYAETRTPKRTPAGKRGQAKGKATK